MAFVTPTDVTVGSVLTASKYNQEVVENTVELRNRDGLVHVLTQTVTAASPVNVNGCFSSAFENYKVVIRHTSSEAPPGTAYSIRLRVSGSDNSTANSYVRERLISSAGSVSGATTTGADWNNVVVANNTLCTAEITFSRPFVAATTGFLVTSSRSDSVTTSGGQHNQSTSYDGFSLIAGSGTITGVIRVYGYNDGV